MRAADADADRPSPAGTVDADLSQRLLDGPLRTITATRLPDDRSCDGCRLDFSASSALATYFHGSPRQFSGALFDSFGGGGDRLDVENRITRQDLLAVAAVNATMPAAVASQLLSEPISTRLAASLRQLPGDVDLWDADDRTLAVATEAWDTIRTLDGSGNATADRWSVADKLLARKRPRLLPLYDVKVRRVVNLAAGANWWLSLRAAMSLDGEDNEIRDRVRRAMSEADVGHVSVLRGLDVILWSYATSAKRHHSSIT